jgi:Tetratricopeptide repeat
MMHRTCVTRLAQTLIFCLLAAVAGVCLAGVAEPEGVDEATAIGERISTAFNERQGDVLARMIDMEALAARVAATVSDNEKQQAEFARGFLMKAKSGEIVQQVFAQLDSSEGSSTKFMRVVQRGTERRPVVRFDWGNDGFEYMEFVIQRDRKGTPRILDWIPLSSGEMFSAMLGSTARLVMEAPGVLARVFGVQRIDPETITRMKRIAELRKQGKSREAYDEMEKLPAELADSRPMLIQRASLANEFKDEASYRRMLVRLEQLHGDHPSAAFMLLDHYFYSKDLNKCLQAISAIEKQVGADGMTHLLRANIHVTMGMYADAIADAREGIRLEPDFVNSYFTLAQAHVALGQFGEAVEVYSKLEQNFGYQFARENFVADASFGKFVASPPFRKWLGK